MKKIISIVIIAVMLVASLAITASADTYNPGLHCDTVIYLKKADPANVIKDGIIGDGEYERLEIDTDLETSTLNINFGNPLVYEYAEALLPTMQYFFSWDEVHGFNFAVRWKPTHPVQILDKADSYPRDRFMSNAAVSFSTDTSRIQGRDDTFFYYSMARRTDDGRYLFADYGQLGAKGAYTPQEGEYNITYEADGYITCEWSIPLDNLLTSVYDGAEIYFSVVAGSGTGTPDMDNSEDGILKEFYNISLGDYGFGTKRDKTSSNVTGIITSEALTSGSDNTGDTTPDTTPGTTPSTDNPGTEPGKNTDPVDTANPGTDPVDTDNPGTDPVNPADPENPSSPTNPSNPTNPGKAPSTADPIIIAAIASAVSACGYMISKKHR